MFKYVANSVLLGYELNGQLTKCSFFDIHVLLLTVIPRWDIVSLIRRFVNNCYSMKNEWKKIFNGVKTGILCTTWRKTFPVTLCSPWSKSPQYAVQIFLGDLNLVKVKKKKPKTNNVLYWRFRCLPIVKSSSGHEIKVIRFHSGCFYRAIKNYKFP